MPVVAFRDGEFSPLSEMTVGIETTALHYGTNVFEGIRAYWNADIEELYVFRAQDHFKRLHASASIYGMSLPYTVDELCAITQDLLPAMKCEMASTSGRSFSRATRASSAVTRASKTASSTMTSPSRCSPAG